MSLVVSILLAAPAIGMAAGDGSPILPDELLAGTVLDLDPEAPVIASTEEVMALSDDMRKFLESHVNEEAESSYKLRQLAQAIISDPSFALEYEEVTRTAAEAFRTKKANCMSYTNMFVVLARGVGLDARFQEVDIPPDWTYANDTYVLNLHININVEFGLHGEQVVDFNIVDFDADYEMRIISDERAMAHFFNNLGAELLQDGRLTEAFMAFRRAIAENDRLFSPAWTNLGTLYNRTGHADHAEAAYLQALEADRSDLIAMSNLTALYERRGDHQRAAHYGTRVETHRRHNPYYRYQLAREALSAGDPDSAIDHLKYASRELKNEDRFCALLAAAYLQKGDEGRFRRWMGRAVELASTDELRRLYSSKIEKLRSASR
jgi:Flp pilus assembly protein TadD